jgi:Bifunctional DNA primase/polymerase, N-terminal
MSTNRRPLNSSIPVARALLKRFPSARLFPIERGKKFPPLIENNLARANSSILWCEKQHARFPFCNWGLALPGDDILVIDIDTNKGGDASLFDLEMKHGDLPATFTVRTASGGQNRHLYFRCTQGRKAKFALGKLGLGIDCPNYVLVAGDIVDGKPYTITNDVPMAVAPEWIWTEYLDKQSEHETVEQAPAVDLDLPENE